MTAQSLPINGPLAPLWAAISCRGADVRQFLQAQLSCDVSVLSPQRSLIGACLNPKGRVLGLLLLIDQGEEIIALVHPTLRESLIQRLQMFVLRARVTLEAGDHRVVGETGVPAGETPRLDHLPTEPAGQGCRVAWPGDRAILVDPPQADEAPLIGQWLREDCHQRLPHVTAETSDRHIGQMLNLDRLGAINFRKGCFPGQEIVARAHYRGQVKRRLHAFRSDKPMAAGDRLLQESGSLAGEVLFSAPEADAQGYPLLAVVRDESAGSVLSDASGVQSLTPLDSTAPS